MSRKFAVLMPAFEERASLASTLSSLRAAAEAGAYDVTVFLVDDGSEPPLALPDARLSGPRFAVVAARHAVNLGQGAALETARQLAVSTGEFDAYVTMDADGQHAPEDALALADAVQSGADVVFGDRFGGRSNVPPARALLLRAARLFEWAVTGLLLSDAHNGLRAFGPRAIHRIALRQNRMAHATEIKQCVSRAELVVREMPVSVRYTRESLKKGQPSVGAFRIVKDLIAQWVFGDAPLSAPSNPRGTKARQS